jgi:hypothetical protein
MRYHYGLYEAFRLDHKPVPGEDSAAPENPGSRVEAGNWAEVGNRAEAGNRVEAGNWVEAGSQVEADTGQ